MAERSNTRRVSFDPMVLISRLFSLDFIRLFIYYLCVEVDEGMCLLQGVCGRKFWDILSGTEFLSCLTLFF